MAAATPHWFEKTRPGARRMSGLTDLLASVAKVWNREFVASASCPGEVGFKGCAISTVEQVLAATGPDAVLAQLRTSWDVPVVLRFGKSFVTAAVEALFGGSGDEIAVDERPGPLSPIEAGVADAVATQVAAALAEVVGEAAPVTILFDRLLPKADPTGFGKPQAPLLVASFTLQVLGTTAVLDMLLSQAALDLLGEDLGDLLDGTRSPPHDPQWSEQLSAEVGRASVSVQAVVDALPLTLAAVAALRPGQVLAMPPGAGSRVRLTCGERDLFGCELGQSNGLLTVRVT